MIEGRSTEGTVLLEVTLFCENVSSVSGPSSRTGPTRSHSAVCDYSPESKLGIVCKFAAGIPEWTPRVEVLGSSTNVLSISIVEVG